MKNQDQIVHKSRLRWACRRGMLELDALFERFLDNHYDSLGADQQQAFEDLLDCTDDQLFKWLFGRQSVDNPEFSNLIILIKESPSQ